MMLFIIYRWLLTDSRMDFGPLMVLRFQQAFICSLGISCIFFNLYLVYLIGVPYF